MLKVGPHITHSSVTRLRPRFGLAGLAGLLVALQFGCEQKADANGRADSGSAQADAARGDSASGGDGQRDGGQGNGAQDSGSSGSRDSGSRDAAGSDSDLPDAAEGERDASESGPQQKCVVFLHGKSGGGFATQTRAEYLFVAPTGNADGESWGGRQWLYFPDDRLTETRQIIAQAIADNGCTKVLIHGFSNGGAAAAKLYCRGVTFDKKVVGYVVDDPVPDHGADGCKPPTGVKLRLYWTSALTPHNGWNCQEGDWTCEGGTTVGIQTYAANLGVPATKSAKTNHEPYNDPPEYQNWW